MSVVLFVDDEEHIRLAAAQAFELNDLEAELFENGLDALARIDEQLDAVVVTDVKMPSIGGLELLKSIRELDPDFPVILVSGHGDIPMAVDSMRIGAYDFIEKPFSQKHLIDTVKRAQDKRRLTLEVRSLKASLTGKSTLTGSLPGKSPAIEKLKSKVQMLAGLEADILITGDTGTGKDTVAKLLHDLSPRKNAEFVSINCAAIPKDLLELELFGHEAGAFPSATTSRYGKFEYARGGTVFLDAVDMLPIETQAKLLHAIDKRTITRLGSNQPVELDVKFITASHLDLKELIKQDKFRSDLYYRLAKAEILLPDLDDRREDIPALFQKFVVEAALRHNKDTPEIEPQLLTQIATAHWPGNLRELNIAAERFVLGIDLELGHELPVIQTGKPLSEIMAEQERAIIASVLAAHNGSLRETYETLQISRKALYEKMQKLDLKREDFVKVG